MKQMVASSQQILETIGRGSPLPSDHPPQDAIALEPTVEDEVPQAIMEEVVVDSDRWWAKVESDAEEEETASCNVVIEEPPTDEHREEVHGEQSQDGEEDEDGGEEEEEEEDYGDVSEDYSDDDEESKEIKTKAPSKKPQKRMKKNQRYKLTVKMMKDMGVLNCNLCATPFDDLRDLNQHARTEHGKSTCHIFCCEKRFNYKDSLQHMNYHMDPTAYACCVCQENFMCRRHLLAHQRIKHKMGLNFPCEHCDQRFYTPSLRDMHTKKIHPTPEDSQETFKCDICGKSE